MGLKSLDVSQFEARKKSHLEISLEPEMQTRALSDWDQVKLAHDALPELDFAEIDLKTPFLMGKARRDLATPFFVSGMTAGHSSAAEVNDRLARACARRGWIFGVGSQRRELESAGDAVDGWSTLKTRAPGLVILGNLGISQAIRAGVPAVSRLAKNLKADAFCVHLNALQEVLQPEGTPEFRGGLKALKTLASSAKVPLVLKETGCGFSPRTLKKLRGLKLAAVDVSGLGGTHWGRIEGRRAEEVSDRLRARAAETFADWGISTIDSIREAALLLAPTTEIWASGGIRSGLDAAKAIALGATRVGFAKPALVAALAGEAELESWMESIEFELKTALFCTGYRTPRELKRTLKSGKKKAVSS